jgi:hypothetical protein
MNALRLMFPSSFLIVLLDLHFQGLHVAMQIMELLAFRSALCYQHVFTLGRYYSLKPDIKVISPWREWDLTSRSKLIAYAESRGIAVPEGKRGEPPFSMDANLLHISYEG